MAELVDAMDSKPIVARHESSSLSPGTDMSVKILCIAGPTASGKSARAVEEALAKNGEIISVDSRQVYRDLDIGTEKIIKEDGRRIFRRT